MRIAVLTLSFFASTLSILLLQSVMQHQILKYLGLKFRAQFKNLYICNSLLYSPTLIAGYFVFPLQVFLQTRYAKLNRLAAIQLGFIEFFVSLLGQFIVGIPLFFFYKESFNLHIDFISSIQLILVSAAVITLGVFLKRISRKLNLKYEIMNLSSKEKDESLNLNLGLDISIARKILTFLPLFSFGGVTYLFDSAILFFLLSSNVSAELYFKVYLGFLFAYLIGVVSQIPGGVGVRELTASAIFLQLGLGSILEIATVLGVMRICKIISGGAFAALSLYWIKFKDVQVK